MYMSGEKKSHSSFISLKCYIVRAGWGHQGCNWIVRRWLSDCNYCSLSRGWMDQWRWGYEEGYHYGKGHYIKKGYIRLFWLGVPWKHSNYFPIVWAARRRFPGRICTTTLLWDRFRWVGRCLTTPTRRDGRWYKNVVSEFNLLPLLKIVLLHWLWKEVQLL